jgi:hypothetical protein
MTTMIPILLLLLLLLLLMMMMMQSPGHCIPAGGTVQCATG